MIYLLKGLALGFAYVAPIGVQNLFCINTALTQSKKRAYIAAFIIMFFDITLALACFMGIGLVMSASKWLELVIMGIGSLIVMYIGYSILKSKASLDSGTRVDIPIIKVISTACVVTWFNPQALIDGSMLLGASKAAIPSEFGNIFILGMCLASAIWWLILTSAVLVFKSKITAKVFNIINIVCGAFILFYGANLFWDFIKLAKTMF